MENVHVMSTENNLNETQEKSLLQLQLEELVKVGVGGKFKKRCVTTRVICTFATAWKLAVVPKSSVSANSTNTAINYIGAFNKQYRQFKLNN